MITLFSIFFMFHNHKIDVGRYFKVEEDCVTHAKQYTEDNAMYPFSCEKIKVKIIK